EQAVAEEVAVGAEDAALDEFFGVVDDDIFDEIGVEEEKGADLEKAKADDVAVFAGGAGHEGERILAERAAEAVEEALFGAGGIVGHGEMVCGRREEGKRVLGNEGKNGRREEWKSGRVEEWKSGRVEEWKSGRVEEENPKSLRATAALGATEEKTNPRCRPEGA